MKTSTGKSYLILLFILSPFHMQAQRMSAEDMANRERENLYKKLGKISATQQDMLDGIYKEYAQSYEDLWSEVIKTRSWDKLRSKMETLNGEKHRLVRDVLNEAQFLIYKRVTKLKNDEAAREGLGKWTVKGILADGDDGSELIGAAVKLINVKDSLKSKYAVTDYEGNFEIKGVENAFYQLIINSMGYKPHERTIRVGVVDTNLGRVFMQPDARVLEAVEVEAELVPIEQRGDTILYNADAYKVNKDASTKDLVSKMPGIVVDGTGVSANGETVQQVLLDGKRFFGQDPLLSLNTIPAEVVKKVEVFDQQSEQSRLTGFDDGNTTKTINVVTREGKRNGKFGRVYAGLGTNDHYKAGANINSFNKDRRLTVIGMTNNINVQNFSDEDLAGLSGSGSGSRRGGGNSLMTGTQSGITQTNSVGVNFTDNLGKKATLEGSYFFNQTDNTRDTKRSRQLSIDGSDYYKANNRSNTDNLNHRLNIRINYDINNRNRLIVRPLFSYQDNSSLSNSRALTRDSRGDVLVNSSNTYINSNRSYNFNNEIDFQHKFRKIGRTLSIELETLVHNTDRESNQDEKLTESGKNTLTNYQYITKENRISQHTEITYTEPVGTSRQLALRYRMNYRNRSSDRKNYIQDEGSQEFDFNSELSNEVSSGYTTHSTAIYLRNRGFGKFFNAGFFYQYAVLDTDQLFPEPDNFQRKFNNILPFVMGRLDFKGGGDMFFRYSGSTREPSVNQLQNVLDRTNSLLWSLGNPDLKQSYTHSVYLRLSKTNVAKNTSLSNRARASITSSYMTNENRFVQNDEVLNGDIQMPAGTQISRPVNLNGYWDVNNSTTYGFTLSKLKSKVNTTLGLNYTRQPGLNNGIKNVANIYSASMRVSFVSNVSEDIDFNVYYHASTNTVANSSNSRPNNQYTTQRLGGKFNLTFWKGFVLRSDIVYQMYNAVNDQFDTTYALWSLSLAKKILKNDLGELQLSVFDLLKQNNSVSQSVTPLYLQETITQVLQQYFMLTFSYQIRQFKMAKE